MSVATMVIGGRTTDVTGQTYFFFAPLLIPLFILGVPIVDMAFAFVRRTAKGTQFHSPDKDHIHHRLLRLGHGPRRTVVILWGWTADPLRLRARSALLPAGNSLHPARRRRARAHPLHLVPSGPAQARSRARGAERPRPPGGPGRRRRERDWEWNRKRAAIRWSGVHRSHGCGLPRTG